tara:strand:+ start:483 stop:716 length:234 start_codon:yes stop_codon:yes gene_type:complete
MKIIIYTTSWCPSCDYAKRLLAEKGHSYKEINIEQEGWSRSELFKITGGRTVPQIVINDNPIGGYEDLCNLSSSGLL